MGDDKIEPREEANPIRSSKAYLETSNSSESLASSIGSHDYQVPVALDQENEPDQANKPRKRSFSTFSGQALNSLRSITRTSSMNSSAYAQALSRVPTGYSVKDIYGEMNDADISLRRSATRNTILDSLHNRVQEELDRSPSSEVHDDEKDLDKKESRQDEGLYENIPDVPVPAKNYGGEYASLDPELVTWNGEDDPEYPRNWPVSEKVFQTVLVSIYTLISPMSSSMLSPAMDQIAQDIHITKDSVKSLSVSIMILAWAVGPLLIAPLSESDKMGRRTVLNFSIWAIFFFNLGCGFVKTPAQLCVLRFLGGLGGCAPLSVGAGTLADLWSDSHRQIAMAAYSISPTLGPVLAPVISSFIVQNKSWHWVFYVLAIFNGAVAVFGLVFFKETYSPRLLRLKAIKLRKETGNEHLHTIYEIADGETKWGKISVNMSRPIKLLFKHPMVLGLGSFMAFVYGFMYIMVVTFPAVFRGIYGFSIGISGLMYLPMGIGYVIGTVFWAYVIQVVYERMKASNGGVSKPEHRLPCLCFASLGIPVGLVWYGWSAQKHLHWIMPSIGSAIFAFSFVAVFQTIQNYLIDMNNRFAASSVAAAAVFRSCFGFAFPLFANSMYAALNYGWGNTLFALIGLALGLPFPVFCLMYGERLRNWANVRMDREQAARDARNLERLKKQQASGYK